MTKQEARDFLNALSAGVVDGCKRQITRALMETGDIAWKAPRVSRKSQVQDKADQQGVAQ